MTAIKPIAERRVVSVAAETYPINTTCAHPDCSEEAVDPHHSFPRSAIGGDSFFVSITFDTYEQAVEVLGKHANVTEVFRGADFGTEWISGPVPHAIGLCRRHHEAVEARVAKITLEEGTYLLWEGNDGEDGNVGSAAAMTLVGELNPQPGATKTKPKRSRFSGEQRRKRKTISLRVPDDTEDGGAVWDEVVERTQKRLVDAGLYSEGDRIPVYEAVVAGLNDWLNSL